MKNFHYSRLLAIILAVVVMSGCGTTNTQPTFQTPVMNEPVVNDTTGVTNNTVTGYTLVDVAKHGTASDCWIVIVGKIYDLTSYAPMHPKSPDLVTRNCGKDGTSIFNLKHDQVQLQLLNKYFVADLK